MSRRICSIPLSLTVLAFLAAALLGLTRFPSSSRWALGAEEEGPQKKSSLPPLVVDTDSPLLMRESKKKQQPDKEIAPSVAENAACYVCHENYSTELMVAQHADGDVGCIDCHGKSYDHRNDENNTTPPDIMFPRKKIEASCAECHETHDVTAAEVIARLNERLPRITATQDIYCTDCHGAHRLAHRTVVWDKETRQLLTGKQDSPPEDHRPTLETLKKLAGVWVQATEDGTPTDKVVSTYRVTAAGSAVMEVLFPGQPHEMVTVYHQDGNDLLLTHYCSAGNQPRMKCNGESTDNQFVFEFVDATNMKSTNDQHMHAATLTVIDDNHVRARWQAYTEGKPAELVEFNLVRASDQPR